MAELYKPEASDNILASMFRGISMALLALANELDKSGALPIEQYRGTLDELRASMPIEDAGVGAGSVFEFLIDRLDELISNKRP